MVIYAATYFVQIYFISYSNIAFKNFCANEFKNTGLDCQINVKRFKPIKTIQNIIKVNFKIRNKSKNKLRKFRDEESPLELDRGTV